MHPPHLGLNRVTDLKYKNTLQMVLDSEIRSFTHNCITQIINLLSLSIKLRQTEQPCTNINQEFFVDTNYLGMNLYLK